MDDPAPGSSTLRSRRRILKALAAPSIGTVAAGCSSDGSRDVQDSDGDGVIDSEDYAPQDPDVQEKSDVQQTETGAMPRARTKTPAPESTPTPSPSPSPVYTSTPVPTPSPPPSETSTPAPRSTPTPARDSNSVTVSAEEFAGTAYVTEYSSREVSASVDPSDPDLDGVDLDRMNLFVATQRFPAGEIVATGRSDDTADGGATKTLSVETSGDALPRGDPLHHTALLIDRETDVAEADQSSMSYVHETDPFEVRDGGRRLVRLGPEAIPELAAIDGESGEYHERSDVEGAAYVVYRGQTNGQPWSVNLYVYKSSYVEARRRDHGRSRPEFVAYEISSGFSRSLAPYLDRAAERNGFTGKREKVEFVVDFVQYLPYVPDDVSRGFDDYTMYGIETFAEGGGDCEDTSILLAAVLQSEPFNYDMVLIQPPGHMAAGILGSDDLPGYYWTHDGSKYYYIETTGKGWGIGDLPETYRDVDAYVHQV